MPAGDRRSVAPCRLDKEMPGRSPGISFTLRLPYLPSQAFTLAWLAFTHCAAALSGSTCFPAIRLATMFWSSAVHFQRLITEMAGEPLLPNFEL
jgi:hypothetical protein